MFKALSNLIRKASANPSTTSDAENESPIDEAGKQLQEVAAAVGEVAATALDRFSEVVEGATCPETGNDGSFSESADPDEGGAPDRVPPGPTTAEAKSAPPAAPELPETKPSVDDSGADPAGAEVAPQSIEELAFNIFLERTARGEEGDAASDWAEAERRLTKLH